MDLEGFLKIHNFTYNGFGRLIGYSGQYVSRVSRGIIKPSQSFVLLVYGFTKGQVDLTPRNPKNKSRKTWND